MVFDAKPPAIIRPAAIAEIRFGLSYAISRTENDRFTLPADFRDATLAEILPYLPRDLRGMPHWGLEAMLLVPLIGWDAGSQSTTFLTATSTSTQTWTVEADWNSGDNNVQIVSHAGAAANNIAAGGGGGYAKGVNISLTPGGSATYRLAPAGNGSDDTHADWFAGASLALSGVGIRGGSNASNLSGGAGASTTNAIGSTKYAGGNGGNAGTFGCCCGDVEPGGGAGAAGPHGAGGNGGNASAGTPGLGGTGDNGNTAANASGTQFDGTHGSGGGGDGINGGNGTAGGNYGASGGGGAGGFSAGTSRPGLIVITNNA